MSRPLTSVQESRIGHANHTTCPRCSYALMLRVKWSGYAWVDDPCYRLVKCSACLSWELYQWQQAEKARKEQLLAEFYELNPHMSRPPRDDPPLNTHRIVLAPPKLAASQPPRTTTATHDVALAPPIPAGLPTAPLESRDACFEKLDMLMAKLKAHLRSSAEAKRTAAAEQPRIVPPAASQKRRKPIPKRVRIVLSLHPKKAAIARFDARIGKASPQLTITDAASTTRKESGATATQPTDVCDMCSTPTGKCLFTLLRPSGEASPLDAITRHLVWLASLT